MTHKFPVDEGKSSFVEGVRLFHAHVKHAGRNLRTVSEGHQLAIHGHRAAQSAQLLPVFKHPHHRQAFIPHGRQLLVGFLVHPLCVEVQTGVKQVGCQRVVFISGVAFAEFIHVVAFGLQLFACQRGQGFASVDVVTVVSVVFIHEIVRPSGFDHR